MAKGKDLKPHIGIFGRRNSGKSSIINLIVDQEVAIVSDEPGTTTDPVKKSIEIPGIGPSIIVDTAGIDDIGELGEKRIQKTYAALKTIDAAILVITHNEFGFYEKELIKQFHEYAIPFLILHNKEDLVPIDAVTREKIKDYCNVPILSFTTLHKGFISELTDELKRLIPATVYQRPSLLAGIVNEGDHILLVAPIDEAAPEGRLILPQVMSIRDVLDNNCICTVLQDHQLQDYFDRQMSRPDLIITDSKVFGFVNQIVPSDIPLTSFSIVFARLKGDFEKYMEGTPAIETLKDGDRVLILESCTHQISCDDIGRHKIPRWITDHTGKNLSFEVVSGLNDISDLHSYSMVIQCGGCVVTRKQLLNRLKPAIDAGIPVSNYGMTIAYINGIFDRVVEPFRKVK